MPSGDPCWTLETYITFALWIVGSLFTVVEVEDSSMAQSESDKGCESATIVPVGVLVELETEDWIGTLRYCFPP